MNERILILGAGPTGLGAAYRLTELGYENFHIFDRNPYVGGLAHSFTDSQGFTWDIGGHVMFSHYKKYDEIFDRLMGDEYQLNMRESWVRMYDRWIPYPFQNNIRYLPDEAAYECMAGLIEAQNSRDPSASRNFEQFMAAVFGDGIVKHFMKPYNFKVWAHPATMMNKEWIGERVAMIDVNRALKNIMLEQDDFAWGPNNMFKFPLKGGTGEFYKRFAPILEDHISLNRKAVQVDVDRREVLFEGGERVKYGKLISSAPLDILCTRMLAGEVPDRIRDAAETLRHSSGLMVGVGIRQRCPSTKSWMYFPEENCPFYRVTYLSNYSPNMTPDKDRCYSLLCETSASAFKPVNRSTIVEDTIQGLVSSGMISADDQGDIVSTWLYEAEYSYPIPTVYRDKALSKVIPWLESKEIYSRGRFGIWKYEVANTDHSIMQGVELVDRLLMGQEEVTIGMKYASTLDGRNAAVHERPIVAGSGEKRLPVSANGKNKISLM